MVKEKKDTKELLNELEQEMVLITKVIQDIITIIILEQQEEVHQL